MLHGEMQIAALAAQPGGCKVLVSGVCRSLLTLQPTIYDRSY